MKSELPKNVLSVSVSILFIVLISWLWPLSATAVEAGAPAATVGPVQGDAQVFSEAKVEPQNLASGATVDAWNTIHTGSQSRLLLNWNNGLITSFGDMSSLFVSVEKRPDREVTQFHVIEGIVRVATREGPGAVTPYAVLTPAAAIEPDDYGNPADFIVESYDPSTSAITVLSGKVRVITGGEGGSQEKTVLPCQTAYVNLEDKSIDVVKVSPEDAARLVSASTLPGSIAARKDECNIAALLPTGPPPGAEAVPPAAAYYPREDYVYIDDSEPLDFYAYDEITVLPPRAGVGCTVVVPGIGQFVIPYQALGNWACDPMVVLPFARRVFFDQCVVHYQDYWRSLWWRRNELHRVMYLAQLAGNKSLLRQARHELDYLNVRLNWTDRRIRRLEHKVSDLEEQQKRVGGRLPRDLRLSAAIAGALTDRTNVKALERFQKKLNTDREVQNRLANLSGQEVMQFRSRLGRERNPEKRLALRNGMIQFNGDVARGKLPIPAKQTEVRDLVGQIGKTTDPERQQRLEGQLLNRLKKAETTPVPEVLEPAKLNSLQKELSRFPNPEKRGDLEKRLTEMQQSLDARREAETNRTKTEQIAAQAAREKSPEKQQELLDKLKDLSLPLAIGGAGAVGLQQLRQRQQNLQQQLTEEKDQDKKAALKRTLEGVKQREQGIQQLEQFRKDRARVIPSGEQLKKGQQDRLPIKREEHVKPLEREQQLQQQKLEQEQRAKQEQQLRLQKEREQKADLLKRQQEEGAKKESEIRRQQQLKLESEKAQQEQLRLRQEKARQDELRIKQEKAGQEQLRLQQERARQEQLKQEGDKARQQQLQQQQEKARQQQLQQQQEKARQEQMRQQEQSRQQAIRQQQEQSRQQAIKQQQEQSRQQAIKQQQDQARQQQMRQQQEQSRQQAIKQQQEQSRQQQMRLQQEQSRQQAIRQQQEQARQQGARQQQERIKQEQLRLQKLKEEEAKKKIPVR